MPMEQIAPGLHPAIVNTVYFLPLWYSFVLQFSRKETITELGMKF